MRGAFFCAFLAAGAAICRIRGRYCAWRLWASLGRFEKFWEGLRENSLPPVFAVYGRLRWNFRLRKAPADKPAWQAGGIVRGGCLWENMGKYERVWESLPPIFAAYAGDIVRGRRIPPDAVCWLYAVQYLRVRAAIGELFPRDYIVIADNSGCWCLNQVCCLLAYCQVAVIINSSSLARSISPRR